MGIYIDITDNIPSNPPASGPPTATRRTDPATSRAPPAAIERAAADHPGWTESGPNHGFPGNPWKSWKIIIFVENSKLPNRSGDGCRPSRACVRDGKRLAETSVTTCSPLNDRHAMGRCIEYHRVPLDLATLNFQWKS